MFEFIKTMMKKMSKPGTMFNKFQAKKGKLRSADAVVKSEQNASHQFGKAKKKKAAKKRK